MITTHHFSPLSIYHLPLTTYHSHYYLLLAFCASFPHHTSTPTLCCLYSVFCILYSVFCILYSVLCIPITHSFSHHSSKAPLLSKEGLGVVSFCSSTTPSLPHCAVCVLHPHHFLILTAHTGNKLTKASKDACPTCFPAPHMGSITVYRLLFTIYQRSSIRRLD